MPVSDAHAQEADSAATDADRRLPVHALDFAVEIARALLTAATPQEVYNLALARLAPAFGAGFACIYLRDPDDTQLLKLEAAYNFPQHLARHLSRLRIREGAGPTGTAYSRREPVEIPNVFDDSELEDWWEPARELGFVSMISLPLLRPANSVSAGRPASAIGAITLYFTEPRTLSPQLKTVLGLSADQLALAAERAELINRLRASNASLSEENRSLEQKFEVAHTEQRLKDEFLVNISHEVRTPLTSVLGYTYLLSEGQLGPVTPRQTEALTRIDGAGNQLLRIIDDLIDLAKLRLGRIEPSIVADDAIQIAQRAAAEAGPLPSGVTFALDAPADSVPVTTDPKLAGRILVALLSNAFKFTDSGSVTLQVRRLDRESGGIVEWSVEDTGVGIPADRLSTIFDEFSQADDSETRNHGGAGVGLALCRGFAALLNGRLIAESEVGRGSTFRFRVPTTPA